MGNININPDEILNQAKSGAWELIQKAEAYLEGLIGIDINADFLILCGVGVVTLGLFIWLAVLCWRKTFNFII